MRLPMSRPAAAPGFTLLEMLVTLALLAMVSALLWQAMGQVLRVERLLQRSSVDGQLDTVRREWIRGLIEASLVEQRGAPRQFVGDGQQFSLASAEALHLPGLNARQLQIRIQSDASGEGHRLVISQAAPGAGADLSERATANSAGIELLSWRGRSGGIRYLDASGQWQSQWPTQPAFVAASEADEQAQLLVQRAAAPRLPRAVWLDLGADVGGPLISAIGVTETGRPRLAQWELQ